MKENPYNFFLFVFVFPFRAFSPSPFIWYPANSASKMIWRVIILSEYKKNRFLQYHVKRYIFKSLRDGGTLLIFYSPPPGKIFCSRNTILFNWFSCQTCRNTRAYLITRLQHWSSKHITKKRDTKEYTFYNEIPQNFIYIIFV